MGKRTLDNAPDKDAMDAGAGDETVEAGVFTTAAPEELEKRVFVTAKRRMPTSSSPSAVPAFPKISLFPTAASPVADSSKPAAGSSEASTEPVEKKETPVFTLPGFGNGISGFGSSKSTDGTSKPDFKLPTMDFSKAGFANFGNSSGNAFTKFAGFGAPSEDASDDKDTVAFKKPEVKVDERFVDAKAVAPGDEEDTTIAEVRSSMFEFVEREEKQEDGTVVPTAKFIGRGKGMVKFNTFTSESGKLCGRILMRDEKTLKSLLNVAVFVKMSFALDPTNDKFVRFLDSKLTQYLLRFPTAEDAKTAVDSVGEIIKLMEDSK